jgi:uncharacterized phage protein (TIGR01671 family)
MNNRFKFRVWHTCEYGSGWVKTQPDNWVGPDNQPWQCMSFKGEIMHNDNMGGYVNDKQENYIIQQFTGFKDSTGKDIYEGDICKYTQSKFASIKYPEENGEIYWNSNGYFFRHKDGEFNWRVDADFCRESLTIVGNIFDNLELLK